MAASGSANPRYEAHENPPFLVSLGFGLQFGLIASATLLITPVVVAKAAGQDEAYLLWMVFASLLVVGIATLIQVRRLGFVGAGAVLPMTTAPFAIPFCISALVDGGPATLTTLILVTGVFQVAISKWLFLLRRIVTPVVGGTVLMILSITLASVVFGLLNEASMEEPTAAPLTALATLVVVAALVLRGSPVLRLWAPVIGIAVGCVVAALLGIYDASLVTRTGWVGLPSFWPGLGLDFSIDFWTLLPAFLFLGIIISIQVNGESITQQRAAWREQRAIDFREVQGSLSGAAAANLMAGAGGAVPIIVNSGGAPFIQATGMASRRVGYCIAGVFIILAFVPKASGLLSTIPGPVMTGYLILVTGTLFVEGARTVIQSERDRQKLTVAGISYWIAAAFQFGLFALPNLGHVWGALLKSGVTTGGITVIVMILFLEVTSPRRMRFQAPLHVDSLPDLNAFVAKFAARKGWGPQMVSRLEAAAEETLLTLAPLDLTADIVDDGEDEENQRRLVVLALVDGQAAELEFIGGANEENLEDRLRQMQEHVEEDPMEHATSLRLLRSFASSVQHQQYQDTEIITVRIEADGK
ncbi:MAG: purine/pyrimidine permease [Chloroflexota bacterium]|nr:purine/pyrimidine permease [Chloroflexota bacterium]